MTPVTADLIAFLNARLEEDASFARATMRRGAPPWAKVGRGERIPEMAHIERHSPARALREVEAKRAILEMYASTLALVEHPPVMPEDHPHAGKISARDYMDAKRELAVLRPAVAGPRRHLQRPPRLPPRVGADVMSSDYYGSIAGEIADRGAQAEAAFLEWEDAYARREPAAQLRTTSATLSWPALADCLRIQHRPHRRARALAGKGC